MEDGLNVNETLLPVQATAPTKNGVSLTMASDPGGIESATTNGNLHEDNENSSGNDALVIDETRPKQKVVKKKKRLPKKKASQKQTETFTHSNPYFNKSLFELSLQHRSTPARKKGNRQPRKTKNLKKNNSNIIEYAQYLGLQPAIQFKCSKCHRSGFESLSSLNDHIVQCTADPNLFPDARNDLSSSFKLTRRVFLCSACGTYYENWNLYMHMLDFHRRHICLYCLGMFSALEDLCRHIHNKHDFKQGHKETLSEFLEVYTEPCIIICCECKAVFSEQDNFFFHNCGTKTDTGKSTVVSAPKNNKVKSLFRPEDHITGDSVGDTVTRNENNMININSVNLQSAEDSRLNNQEERDEGKTNEDRDNNFEAVTNPDTMNTSCDNEEVSMEIDETIPNETQDSFMEDNNSNDLFLHDPLPEIPKAEDDISNPDMEIDEDLTVSRENGFVETRKVPKLSLKLPKQFTSNSDSNESENEMRNYRLSIEETSENEDKTEMIESQPPAAGLDVNIVELQLEHPLDKFDIQTLLQLCLKASTTTCIYCNHARKIAVNGKQLGIHAIADHRFSAVVNSITAEELIPESFVAHIRENLDDLEDKYFNLEPNDIQESITNLALFECFQCYYSTNVHKDLYLHNRKMHTKNMLLCIMCKLNFYSYSELICHLCPGVYQLDYDVRFRCCMCPSDDLPSAFRLMVHLRKRHNVCDVCFETCHDQYKLSNHVWKHKLHHFCYRCGIAYRNKLDITRHLFWKHGTESVLCKKCLQKKWPHVYHFCVPPPVFTCEECNLNFTKAVYLKVHKRIHANETPYECSEDGCKEKFVSKKLLAKHEARHKQTPEELLALEKAAAEVADPDQKDEDADDSKEEEKPQEPEVTKPKVDVYDLPELNLSESDSDSDEEQTETKTTEELKPTEEARQDEATETSTGPKSETVLENIWDDFKMYQANKEKMDTLFTDLDNNKTNEEGESKVELEPVASTSQDLDEPIADISLRDHDYCNVEVVKDAGIVEVEPDLSQRVDHDYCTVDEKSTTENADNSAPVSAETKPPEARQSPQKKAQKNNSSDSESSDSSSSCSCGSNCSCSSSSGSSSSSDSSDSESSSPGTTKKQKKKRNQENSKKNSPKIDVTSNDKLPRFEAPILESDLETTESETDEEFYDRQPQMLAKKILEEKRNQVLAEIGPISNGGYLEESRTSTPSLPEEMKPKKKSKSKKRKRKKSERKERNSYPETVSKPEVVQPTVAPLTISLNKNQSTPSYSTYIERVETLKVNDKPVLSKHDVDGNLRASKRRRVPNKFYGYSSDEETEKPPMQPPLKMRKTEPQPPVVPPVRLTVPPLTIRTTPYHPPPIEPITIRPTARPGEMRIHNKNAPVHTPIVHGKRAPIGLASRNNVGPPLSLNSYAENSSGGPPKDKPVQLYCYCQCPYDEVSEMIGCDSNDCAIEWFHFECVGIMVPPKGQWFCPDCRKKKQQRKEALQM